MKHSEWMQKAYFGTRQELAGCFESSHVDAWSENYITTRLLLSIESLGLEIDWEDRPQRVKWEGYKLKGLAERDHGDVAVVVRVWVTGDRYIDGVAFYEAKRQFFKENNEAIGFSSIKIDQLSHLHNQTHASNLLLYDVDIEKEDALASSVPLIFVEQLAKSNLANSTGRLLHHYGEPWIKALAYNFVGMNLDYRQEVVDTIKGYGAAYKKPSFLINASVGMTSILEPTLDNSFINRREYDHWIKKSYPKPKRTRRRDLDDDFSP